MKQNRLFEIVYLLLDRGKMTAGELAACFEVSPRTIYRDVETLCQSGIPKPVSAPKTLAMSASMLAPLTK